MCSKSEAVSEPTGPGPEGPVAPPRGEEGKQSVAGVRAVRPVLGSEEPVMRCEVMEISDILEGFDFDKNHLGNYSTPIYRSQIERNVISLVCTSPSFSL